MPYGVIGLGRHWFKVMNCPLATTWTSADLLSFESSGKLQWNFNQISDIFIHEIASNITFVQLCSVNLFIYFLKVDTKTSLKLLSRPSSIKPFDWSRIFIFEKLSAFHSRKLS